MLTACRASAPPPSSFLRAYSVPIQRQFEMFIRGSIALARQQIQAPAPWFKGQSNAEQRAALRHVTKQGARLVPLNPRSRSACQIADQVCTADDPIWVANVNSATQTVFSGTFEVRRQLHLAAEIEALVVVERSPQPGELATTAAARLPR